MSFAGSPRVLLVDDDPIHLEAAGWYLSEAGHEVRWVHGTEAAALQPVRTRRRARAMKKLLIVDDEEIVLGALKEHLELDGYTVDCASEREEALALLANCRYDCAIIDLCLSPAYGADGLDVVAFAAARSPATRIVVFTAFASLERKAEATELGADTFLEKATPLPEVSQLVARLVGDGA